MNEQHLTRTMRHALTLAARGPRPGINPQVGCVILSPAGDTLAEGWHRGAGTAHAEVDALSKLTPDQTRGATAVVTLEPCNHTGLTGPCVDALIASGVANVVYGASDPNPRASGGSDRLRAAGITVTQLLADEASEFSRRWLITARHARPFVSVKWAASLDGRAAASDGSSQWITGTAARQHVHEQRTSHDAILVGTGTVLADNPTLTARGDAGELLADQPIPVVLGNTAVPEGARLHEHPNPLIHLPGHDVHTALSELYARDIRSVFVEGGPTVASAFLAAGLADELLVYVAPVLLGGDRLAVGDLGIRTIADAHRYEFTSVTSLGADVLLTARPATTDQPEAKGP